MATYKITLSASNWTQTTAALYWDTVSQAFYADAAIAEEVAQIVPPTRECWQFNGFYAANSATAPGAQYIDGTGAFTKAFFDKCLTLSGALTIYVSQTQIAWKLTLNDNDGADGSGALYYRIDGGEYFYDDLCKGEAATTVARPRRSGYAFAGYHNGTTTPGTQYIDAEGNFTDALTALALSADKKVYARWVAPYKVTVSANDGTGGTAAFYYDSVNGLFYATTDLEQPPITSITPHTRATYRLLGAYATNATTGAQHVAPDGTIAPDFAPTKATTIYAQWLLVSYKLTLAKNSGTGGTDALYCSNGADAPAGWYLDDLCKTAATGVVPPTRSGYAAKGAFTSALSSGTLKINRDGSFTEEFASSAITAAKTYTWQWNAARKITLDREGGTGGTDALWYSALDDAYFGAAELDQQISAIVPPLYECYRFNGYFSAAANGTQYITPSGQFTDALTALAPTKAMTFHAQWTRVSWKLTLDDNGGTGGAGAIYNDGANADYFADEMLAAKVTSVAVPTKRGHTALGYFASTSGGSKYVNADGSIAAAVGISANVTAYARYTPNQYTLRFAEGPTAQKQVTYGSAIGTLPAPTKDGFAFAGWFVGAVKVEPATIWDFDADKTAEAAWLPHVSDYFGNVEDYFNIGNDSLVPIQSDSGDNRQRVCVCHSGKYEPEVNQTSGVWRNPTVTYAVIHPCTLNVSLGKAFAAVGSGANMTRSGYMIAEVSVQTSVGNFPTVTVTGVANEGADAINLFPVSVPIAARSKAQNLMGAISGGGKLNSCTLVASCEPVVIAEHLMPCASDAVNGKVTVNAQTVATAGESAPTAANGFSSLGEPKQTSERYYATWQITAEKELS